MKNKLVGFFACFLFLSASFNNNKLIAQGSCKTWTFKLKLGNTSTNEKALDLLTLADDSYIICGSNENSNGAEGLLVKLNNKGELLWSRTFSLAQENIFFKKIKYFSNGRVYVLGESTNKSTAITSSVIACVDVDGNIVWTKRLSSFGVSESMKAIDAGEWQNTFSVLSSNNLAFNVTKFNLDGQARWSKTYKTSNAHTAIGIGNDYSDIYVGYNETESGYGEAVMVDLDNSTGNFKFASKVGGQAENCSYSMQSMRMINMRPRVTAIQIKDNIASLVRLNYSPTAFSEIKETFTYEGAVVSTSLTSAQNEWSEIIGLSNGNDKQAIYLTATFPDNTSTPITTKKISFSSPINISNIIRSNDGGSILTANTLTPDTDIVITKTDSIFSLPGCGSEPVLSNFTYSVPPQKAEVLVQQPGSSSLNNIQLTAKAYAVNMIVECKMLFCPTAVEPDNCLGTFSKEYRNSTNSILSRKMFKTKSGNLLTVGFARKTPYIADDNCAINIFDTLGRLIKSTYLSAAGISQLDYTIVLKDGSFLFAGYSTSQSNSSQKVLIKLDENLNVLWQKYIDISPSANKINNLLESQEGDIYCSIKDNVSSFEEVRYLLKLNSSGSPVWFKKYTAGPNIFPGQGEYEGPLGELSDFIYLKYSEESSDRNPHLLKIRKTDGGVDWTKKFKINDSNDFTVKSMLPLNGNLYIYGYTTSGAPVMFATNPEGRLVGSKIINGGFSGTTEATITNSQKFLLSLGFGSYPNPAYGIVELDQQFKIQRQQFVQSTKSSTIYSAQPYSDSVTYTIGNYFYPNPYWTSINITKYNFNSSFGGCDIGTVNIPVSDLPMTVTTETTGTFDIALPTVTEQINVNFLPGDLAYDKYYCGSSPVCNTIDLDGSSSICDSAKIYTYHLQKNAGCSGSITWQFDTIPGQIKIIEKTDDSVKIKGLMNGRFKIRSKIFGSCKWIEDSVDIAISISSLTLDLGPDTLLCPGNAILLNAKKGFASYKWQDGSTDSTFNVQQPGSYLVQTTTACGTIYSDAIIVKPAPPIPFTIGPDTSKCNADSITISAPGGFTNYSWSPQYNITSTTSPQVKVFPSRDTAYFIKAEKTPGCYAYDTIMVKVNTSAKINLGGDKSFCSGDSTLLDAGSGFVKYLWSTGASTRRITAKSRSNYSVVAYSAEGCKSYDTLLIVNVFNNPAVQLDKNDVLCRGTSRVLKAGTEGNQYLWNDGSKGPTVTINNTGTYYVTVKDNNGCTGSDTTIISKLVKVPSNFLPVDTTLCSYGSIQIKSSKSFSRYLWNTNASGSGITVSTNGLYWLQVTDDNGCVGRDSIQVFPKQCMEGFYIPNAFTPNNDYKNDIFKPKIFGNVAMYQFTIYNRYGNIIFTTKDTGQGWDGKYHGLELDSGAFIWTCKYQLMNEQAKLEKGIVLLIK